MKSLLRIFAIMRKELLQLSRDRLTFGMIVGIPLIQLTLFGYAINTDVRNLRAALVDQADTHLSRQLIADINASQVLVFRDRVDSPLQLETLLDSGQIAIGLYIPPDFDRRVIEGDRQAAQLLVDGTDPIILGVGQRLTSIAMGFDTQRRSASPAGLLEVRNYYNPERRSAVNIVPGLVGVILTMTMVLFTAVAIVRERERGNLELLINTPVRTTELMLGKIAPYVIIGLIQVVIILGLGWLLFQVPLRGDRLDVLWASLLFIATNLSLGLFISTSATTQFQAMQMTFFIFLPSILLSGFVFPREGMPLPIYLISFAIPVTYFIEILRGVILRGAGLADIWTSVVGLGVCGLTLLSLSVARFQKQIA
ncbi:MAG: ABC transporter permease [Phycisphaerales bacterium]|nr:ABC transporter permease [Phycisphaerales bacterium]